MSSSRNKQGSRTEEDALLDAARAAILAVGLRRTTLTDVARRAGVSRMTIYRRWPDMTTLVGDLMTREWGALTRAALVIAAGDRGVVTGDATASGARGPGTEAWSARRRFVAAVVSATRALRHHPVFRRIVELDPEILLPYLVDRRGRSQDEMLEMMADVIATGAADGSMRAADPRLLARGVLLAAQGFVLSLATMTDGYDEAALDDELRLLLDRYLAPVV